MTKNILTFKPPVVYCVRFKYNLNLYKYVRMFWLKNQNGRLTKPTECRGF